MRGWLALFLVVLTGVAFAQIDSVVILETENFSAWVPTGWTTLDFGGATFWDTYVNVGDSVAAITWVSIHSDDWLISPTLDFVGTADSIILYFWFTYGHFPGEVGSSYVLLSLDDGVTWPGTLVTFDDVIAGNEIADTTIDMLSFGPFSGTCKIAYNYACQNGNYWYVDDVRVVRYYTEPFPPTFAHDIYYRPAMPYNYTAFPETCFIDDMTGVASAKICYDVGPTGSFTYIPMSYVGVDPNLIGEWVGNIPVQPAWSTVDYCFIATDIFVPSSTDTSDTFQFVVQGEYYAFDDVDADPEAPDTVWTDIIGVGYQIDDD